MASLRAPARLEELANIRGFIQSSAQALGVGFTAADDMVQAVDEAVANIILHGYRSQPGEVEIELQLESGALIVRLRDRAPFFDPTLCPDPDLSLPLDQRPVGGMGIFMMRQYVDAISHRSIPEGGNELTLVKKSIL